MTGLNVMVHGTAMSLYPSITCTHHNPVLIK